MDKDNLLPIRERRCAEGIAAISRVARRINASLDLQETLDTIVSVVAELIPCALAEIDLWDNVQQVLVLQAIRSTPERAYPVGQSFPPGRGYTGWVINNRRPLLVPNVDSYQDVRPDILPGELPFKAYLGFPLLEGDTLIGALVLVHDQANAFNEDDLQLLDVLASQAAIAIHNARVYDELTRHHRELSALYSVAEAINQPLELRSLLERALDGVLQVTRADGAAIRLLDSQSDEAVLTAQRGLSERYVQRARRVHISRDIIGEVMRSGQATLSEDMWEDTRVSPELRELLQGVGHRSLAQVPLIAQERVVGVLGIVSSVPGYFDESDLKLLTAIGQQLGVAIDNAQLFEETRQKAHRLAALNAVASVINQSLPLHEILDRAIAKVIEVTKTDVGVVRLLDQATEDLYVASYRGVGQEDICLLEQHGVGKGLGGHLSEHRKPFIASSDLACDQRFAALTEETRALHTFVIAPIWVKEKPVGTLGVSTRQQREFTLEDMDLLAAIADQIGVAVENDRLNQAILAAERMVAVGRVATGVAHDLRSPLGGILRCAEFLTRPEISLETRQKLGRAIVSLARRLIGTSQGILDYVQEKKLPLKLEPCNLSKLLDDVLTVLQVDFSDQGIEVVRDFHYKKDIVVDADRIAQVVYNLAANARDAMPLGGTFSVSTRKAREYVEMRFADTGPGVPEELSDRIFEPFFSYGKSQGAGLGLAIARRIVEEHGGNIVLDSKIGRGATFMVQLPA
ncbi:MAG: GAF domain-containing sensor histidine kinase [Anaerolineales bacterium]|nr:GAF domain-containing sensor histidine kinase [Anaerolineales bacterium]